MLYDFTTYFLNLLHLGCILPDKESVLKYNKFLLDEPQISLLSVLRQLLLFRFSNNRYFAKHKLIIQKKQDVVYLHITLVLDSEILVCYLFGDSEFSTHSQLKEYLKVNAIKDVTLNALVSVGTNLVFKQTDVCVTTSKGVQSYLGLITNFHNLDFSIKTLLGVQVSEALVDLYRHLVSWQEISDGYIY